MLALVYVILEMLESTHSTFFYSLELNMLWKPIDMKITLGRHQTQSKQIASNGYILLKYTNLHAIRHRWNEWEAFLYKNILGRSGVQYWSLMGDIFYNKLLLSWQSGCKRYTGVRHVLNIAFLSSFVVKCCIFNAFGANFWSNVVKETPYSDTLPLMTYIYNGLYI